MFRQRNTGGCLQLQGCGASPRKVRGIERNNNIMRTDFIKVTRPLGDESDPHAAQHVRLVFDKADGVSWQIEASYDPTEVEQRAAQAEVEVSRLSGELAASRQATQRATELGTTLSLSRQKVIDAVDKLFADLTNCYGTDWWEGDPEETIDALVKLGCADPRWKEGKGTLDIECNGRVVETVDVTFQYIGRLEDALQVLADSADPEARDLGFDDEYDCVKDVECDFHPSTIEFTVSVG